MTTAGSWSHRWKSRNAMLHDLWRTNIRTQPQRIWCQSFQVACVCVFMCVQFRGERREVGAKLGRDVPDRSANCVASVPHIQPAAAPEQITASAGGIRWLRAGGGIDQREPPSVSSWGIRNPRCEHVLAEFHH